MPFANWQGKLKARRSALILGVILLGLAAWRDASVLFRYPIAVGFNGYYYVLQVDSLRSQRHLWYPTMTPVVFYGLAGLRYLVRDTPQTVKAGGILIHILLCAGIFALLVSLTGSYWWGLLGMVLAAFAPLHLFLVAEYLKQSLALCLIVWSAWTATRAFQTRQRKWAILTAVFLIPACFSHKSALPTLIVMGLLGLLIGVLTWSHLNLWKRVLLLLAVLLVWTTPLILSAQSYFEMPDWLSRELSQSPRWPFQVVAIGEGLILLLLAPAIVVLLIALRQRIPLGARLVLGAIAFWTVLITISPFLNGDPQLPTVFGRLGLLTYLQVALLLPAFFWLLQSNYRSSLPYIASIFVALMLLTLRTSLPPGVDDSYLLRRQSLINNLPTAVDRLGNHPLILAAHGDQFVVTATTRIESSQRVPENDDAHTLFWLVDKMNCDSLGSSAILLRTEGRNLCTAIVEDSELQRVLAYMSVGERNRFALVNPYFSHAHQQAISFIKD